MSQNAQGRSQKTFYEFVSHGSEFCFDFLNKVEYEFVVFMA